MSEVVLSVQNLSKTFYIEDFRSKTLKQWVGRRFNQGKTRKLKVLDDISFKITDGEFVGIVGKNGMGKSTLLKLIAGIYPPDKGSKVNVGKRLVPFLELGVGFMFELSAKKNVYLNGMLLGMTKKEVDSKYADIIKFAGTEEFMDTPLKNFSSGMVVRLGFSIAIHSEADILLLDEVLAVGDASFQQKCIGVFENIKKQKKTVILVSHNASQVRQFCDRVIVINDSRVVFDGDVDQGISIYDQIE